MLFNSMRIGVAVIFIASVAIAQTPDALLPRDGFRLVDGRWVQPGGEFRFPDILRTELSHGRLIFCIAPSAEWQPKLQPNRVVLGEDQSDRALWRMRVTRSGPAVLPDSQAPSLIMLRTDESAPTKESPPRVVRLTLTGEKVLIRGVGRHEGRVSYAEYHAQLDGTRPRLTVQIEGKGGLDLSGEDLRDMLGQKPQIVRLFLAPMIQQIAGANLLRPRAGDVYRVLDSIAPTSAERAALMAILPQLNADDPAARDAAAKKLDQLGAGGVLAALRLDPAMLTPEQSIRISEFISRNSLGDFDPSSAARDPVFLREAITDPDPRVRDMARELLNELAD